MKTIKLGFMLLLCCVFTASAQQYSALINQLKGKIGDVKLEKETVGQILSLEPGNSNQLRFIQTNTDSKGKENKSEYFFNLAFVSSSGISLKTSKTKISVLVKTADKFKAIGVWNDGKPGKYTDELEIVSENADDAREIEKTLKEAATAAKTAWEGSLKLPADYAGLMSFIQKNTKDFDSMGLKVAQKINQSTNYKDHIMLNATIEEGTKSSAINYDFSIGDLIESSITAETSGFEVFISGKAKEKFITVSMDEKTSYDSEFKLYLSDPAEAKLMETAFRKLIPLAKKELENRLPKSGSGGLEGLAQITSFDVNGVNYEQKINAACVCKYEKNVAEKGKTKTQTLQFNFGDLTGFELDVAKDEVKVSAKTVDNMAFITSFEGDKKSFEKKIEFTLADVEKGRYLLAHLPDIAKKCKQDVKFESFNWVVEKLKSVEIEGLEQSLSLLDGDKSKWKFVTEERGSKKSTTTTYEFNIGDIDNSKSEFSAKGSQLILKINTKGKEKLIKQIVEDKPTFTESFSFMLTDVEDAKIVKASLGQLVGKK